MSQPQSPSGSLGAQIRAFRRTAGMSQETLAEVAGLSVNAVSALERGARQQPYPDTLKRLADALSLTDQQRLALLQSIPESGQIEPIPRPLRTNIRRDPTTFVGREHELGRVSALLGGHHRLVTMTGPGGVGKTRLAVELALMVADTFQDGVWFVDLAPVGELDRAWAALSDQLRPLIGARTEPEGVAESLAEAHCLVVIDNVEQIPGFPTAMADLVRDTNKTTFLVTSRVPLRLRAEQVFPVGPLFDLHSHDERPPLAGLEAAIGLFADRVRAQAPGFEVTSHNRDTIAAICRQTDGLPLAIELAAARVPQLPLTVLLSNLREGLDSLSRSLHDTPERQRTMRSTIDWSVKTLGEEQRELFAVFSVFRGGWNWEAAESLFLQLNPMATSRFLDLASDLIEAGLVVSSPGDGDDPPRLRMLVPIHAYADELLRGDLRHRVQQLHASHYRSLALDVGPRLQESTQVTWLRRLLAEQHNLDEAIEWLLGEEDHTQAVDVIWALWRFWWLGGMQVSAKQWLDRIIAATDEDRIVLDGIHLAQTLVSLGSFVWAIGDDAAAAGLLERGVAVARSAGEGRAQAIGQTLLGVIHIRGGDLESADRCFQEVLKLSIVELDPWLKSWTLAYAGILDMLQKHFGDAARNLGSSLQLARAINDQQAISEALFYLGTLALERGQTLEAAGLLVDGLRAAEEVGEPVLLCFYLKSLAHVLAISGVTAPGIEKAADVVLAQRGAPWYMQHLAHTHDSGQGIHVAPGRDAAESGDDSSAMTLAEASRAARDAIMQVLGDQFVDRA